MALSSYESSLLITVRGQNLLGNMLRRVGTDINALSKNVAAANANVAAVQARMLANAEQTTALNKSIRDSQALMTSKQGIYDAQVISNGLAIAEQRAAVAKREEQLLTQQAAKLREMGVTQLGLQKMTTGSGALQSKIQSANLSEQERNLMSQRVGLMNKNLALQSGMERAQATQIGLQRTINNMTGDNVVLEDEQRSYLEQAQLRLAAVQRDMVRIGSELEENGKLTENWIYGLDTLSLKSQKNLAQFAEQAQQIELAT